MFNNGGNGGNERKECWCVFVLIDVFLWKKWWVIVYEIMRMEGSERVGEMLKNLFWK